MGRRQGFPRVLAALLLLRRAPAARLRRLLLAAPQRRAFEGADPRGEGCFLACVLLVALISFGACGKPHLLRSAVEGDLAA
jgi:hypothetical protein